MSERNKRSRLLPYVGPKGGRSLGEMCATPGAMRLVNEAKSRGESWEEIYHVMYDELHGTVIYELPSSGARIYTVLQPPEPGDDPDVKGYAMTTEEFFEANPQLNADPTEHDP